MSRRVWRFLVAHRVAFIPLILLLASFAVYQDRVEFPPKMISDEDTYVKAARNFTNGIFLEPADDGLRPQNYVHPPLGKLLIAAGIAASGKPGNGYITSAQPYFENERYAHGTEGDACGYVNPDCADDARAWRLASTVFGAFGVVGAYFLALGLFGRRDAGIAAAALLGLDGLYFRHARLAMLEVFEAAFVVWAFVFALGRRPWRRALAGVLFGAAVACKESAVFLLPALVAIMFLRHPGGASWWRRAGATAACALVLPALVFVASYAPFLVEWSDVGGWTYAWHEWGRTTIGLVLFHAGAQFQHMHASPPLWWLPMIRPVRYFGQFFGDEESNIYAIGNPVLWWAGAVALLAVPGYVVYRQVRQGDLVRRAWTWIVAGAPFSRDGFTIVAAALFWFSYVPFFLLHRIMFLYYMAGLVPFLAIFVGGMVTRLASWPGWPRRLAVGYWVFVGGAFLFYLPVVTGQPIDPTVHDAIMTAVPWIRSP